MRRILILLLSFTGLVSCLKSPHPPISIAINPWPGYEFLYLAEHQGYFKQLDLNVRLVQVSTLSDAQRAYINNQVDGFTSTLIEAVQTESMFGKPLNAIIVADYSNGGDVIITHKSVTEFQQLIGKKIGAEVGSLGIYVLNQALEKYNFTLDDVTIINTEQVQGQYALLNGDIDAFISYPPYSIETLKNQHYHSVFSSKEIPNQILDVISLSTEAIENNPMLVARLQQAWQMAIDYHKSNPDEANKIMAIRENISAEDFAATLGDIKVLSITDQKKLFSNNNAFADLALSACQTLVSIQSIESNCQHTADLLHSTIANTLP